MIENILIRSFQISPFDNLFEKSVKYLPRFWKFQVHLVILNLLLLLIMMSLSQLTCYRNGWERNLSTYVVLYTNQVVLFKEVFEGVIKSTTSLPSKLIALHRQYIFDDTSIVSALISFLIFKDTFIFKHHDIITFVRSLWSTLPLSVDSVCIILIFLFWKLKMGIDSSQQ